MGTLVGKGVSLLAATDLSVCCAVLVLAVVLFTKHTRRKTVDPPHNNMILSAEQLADHRMLTAQREAKRGFAACASCGFKNFAHMIHCALCGVSRTQPELPIAVRHDDLREEAAPISILRAHKRREWTRELDDKNRLVWRRRLVEGADCSPGYVLRFDLPPETEPESEREVSKDRQRSLSTGYDPCADVQFELLEPRDVDPTQFPLPPSCADTTDAIEDLKQLVAAHDFPTKYAHFIADATNLVQGGRSVHSSMSVHRDYILEQSVEHINCISEANIRSVRLQVNFTDEGDLLRGDKDVGGLYREWLTLLNEKFVDPDVGLFSCAQRNDQTYFINPQSKRVLGDDHLQHFHASGRLIGRALLEGVMLNFHLSVPLLKMILGTPISFGDLEYLDAEMYRNLTWLLDNDGAESLELDFTVTQCHGGHAETVELIPAGRNIQVNDDNKFEFADRKFRFMMFESVAPQLATFLKGFYELVPQRMLLPFDFEELDYLLCGSDKINISDWKLHTHLALEPRQEVEWFWDVVEEMSSVYHKRLLQFSTGCSRVPLVGFQGLTSYDGQLCKFTLADAGDVGYFRSHACHNILELPKFSTKDDLRAALYAALYSESAACEG
ncbi:NEDD4-like ubiquitin ligase [Phytophthora palmivora]|uniref:HECT-type E3 ubiquitin transferase n=1 Tax=Phytophthora palmivora TaxID=4796 RepID=A0A2P4XQ38_9STRA|nr:NEDD4-like ubiquitin ligase [Phytophthora palmivora]